MLAGDKVIAELDLADATISLISPRPARRFHETYSGARHLFAMYRVPATRAAGRYLETGRCEFSPIGPVFFRPAGMQLECHGKGTDATALHCQIDETRLARSGLSTSALSEQELESTLDVQASHLFSYRARLISEIMRPDFGTAMVVDALLAIVLTDLARYLSSNADARDERTDLRDQSFRRLVERICDVWDVTPKVSELAELAGVGERHLLRLFRERKGMSLADFIRETRLEKAQYLLAHSDMPLKQVAHSLGFSSHSTFTTAFKNETGTTPAVFRLQHRQKHFVAR